MGELVVVVVLFLIIVGLCMFMFMGHPLKWFEYIRESTAQACVERAEIRLDEEDEAMRRLLEAQGGPALRKH